MYALRTGVNAKRFDGAWPVTWAALREHMSLPAVQGSQDQAVTFKEIVSAACSEPHSRHDPGWSARWPLLHLAHALSRAVAQVDDGAHAHALRVPEVQSPAVQPRGHSIGCQTEPPPMPTSPPRCLCKRRRAVAQAAAQVRCCCTCAAAMYVSSACVEIATQQVANLCRHTCSRIRLALSGAVARRVQFTIDER